MKHSVYRCISTATSVNLFLSTIFLTGFLRHGGSRIYKSSTLQEGSSVRWISIARRLNPGETELFRRGRNAMLVGPACLEVCFVPCSVASLVVLRLVSWFLSCPVEFVNGGPV